MNKLCFKSLLFLTLSLKCFSQVSISPDNMIGVNTIASAGSKTSKSVLGLKIREYAPGGVVSSDNPNVEGSPYLFKNWFNKSTIWLDDNIVKLDFVNYNIENESFEIKMDMVDDSILIVKPSVKVNKVKINNNVFKPYLDNELQRTSFFEVLWESGNHAFLTKYKLKVIDGPIDPLTKAYIKPKKYSYNKFYFFLENEIMNPIKLKKSEILKLINPTYVNDVKSFVKKQKLKYNRTSDINKILTYYYSIKS